MFLFLKHCNVHLFQYICEQSCANLCCPHYQLETTLALLHEDPKKKLPGSRPYKAAHQAVGFSSRSTSTNHRVLQKPPHASTLTQACDGRTTGKIFGKARNVLSWKCNHSCDTFASEDFSSNSDTSNTFCYVMPGIKLRVEHIAP